MCVRALTFAQGARVRAHTCVVGVAVAQVRQCKLFSSSTPFLQSSTSPLLPEDAQQAPKAGGGVNTQQLASYKDGLAVGQIGAEIPPLLLGALSTLKFPHL